VVIKDFFWMWDLRIVMELLRLREGRGFLDMFGDFLFATNNVRFTLGEAATAVDTV
jgi:hypothetical protein